MNITENTHMDQQKPSTMNAFKLVFETAEEALKYEDIADLLIRLSEIIGENSWPEHSQYYALIAAYSEILNFFNGESELAEVFLRSPVFALGGKCPADLIVGESGREIIRDLIDRMGMGDLS